MSALDKLIEATLAANEAAGEAHKSWLWCEGPQEDIKKARENYVGAEGYSEGLDEALGILQNYREDKIKKHNPESCGGCAGLGSHTRWCAAIWGKTAYRLGDMAEELDSMGDNAAPAEANILWKLADDVRTAAIKTSVNYRRNLPRDKETTS